MPKQYNLARNKEFVLTENMKVGLLFLGIIVFLILFWAFNLMFLTQTAQSL